ncbi:MAG TPA: serine hydrolase domain-containing protein, partial [Flavobacterium sp.]
LGAGGVISNTEDLTRFIEALFAGKIISAQNVAQMQAIKDNFGMGMFQFPFDDKIAYGHSGGIDAFSAMLGRFPDDGVTFAMTSNGTDFNNNDIAIAALSWYYNKPFAIPVFNTVKVSAGELDKLVGLYSTKDLPMKITVTKNNLTLVAQATGQSSFPMEATDKNIFEYKAAGVVLEFKPEANQMMLKQAGRTFTFTKE